MGDRVESSTVNLQSNSKHIAHSAAAKLGGDLFHKFVEHLISRGSDHLLHAVTDDGFSVFHIAAYYVEDLMEDTIHLLAKQRLNINLTDFEGNTPFAHAVSKHTNVSILKTFLELGSDINAVNERKQNAIFKAVQAGNPETIRFLVKAGCNPNAISVEGFCPLHFAVYLNQFDCLRVLVEEGADVNISSKEGVTSVQLLLVEHATKIAEDSKPEEVLDMVKYLIDQGANVNLSDVDGCTMLHYVPKEFPPKLYHELVVHLKETGNTYIFQAQDRFGYTPLHRAAYNGIEILEETVQLFVSNGVNITSTIKSGAGLVHLVAISGNNSVLQMFLSKWKLDPNATTTKGMTPILTAFNEHNENIHETLKILLEHGANLNIGNELELNPLHMAMTAKVNWETVKLLLEHGVDINKKADKNMTVLHFAVVYHSLDMVNRLITHGADIMSRNDHGNNMVHSAVESGELAKVELFLSLGCDIDALDLDGDTPLQYAFYFNTAEYYKIAELLINKGANVNAVNYRGGTAIDWFLHAYDDEDSEVFKSANLLKLMVDKGCDMRVRNNLDTPMLQVLASHLRAKHLHELLVHLVETGKGSWFLERGHFGETLLHRAVQNEEVEEETLHLLKAQGADFNAVDVVGNSVIFYAILGGRSTRFLNTLISFGCDINTRNGMRDTALHLAAGTGSHLLVFGVITSSEIDVNARNIEGRTALHFVQKGNEQCVDLLIDEGADATLADWYGRKPNIWK